MFSWLKYTLHGECEAQAKNFVVHLYPDMYYPSDKPYFIVGITNLNVRQGVRELSVVLKNLLIEKDKLQSSETAFLCIPQMEAKVLYRSNKNHYVHFRAKSREEFKDALKELKRGKMEVKLNLTSFYNASTVPHKDVDSIETIISNALSPYVHCQVSYLPLFEQTVACFSSYPLNVKGIDGKCLSECEASITLAVNDL